MRTLILLALMVYGLALLGATLVPRPAVGAADDPKLPATTTAQASEPIVGFVLNFHHTDQLDQHLRAIDDIASLGFKWLHVVTPCYQRDGAANRIAPDIRTGHSPRRSDLIALLNHAHRRGLHTSLMPVVLFSQPRGNEWRGKIQPEHWEPWWQSYNSMIDDYVAIANQTHVTSFCIGSELLTTETQTEHWTELIARVRRKFSGSLFYSTNWDHYQTPTFWAKLDMIGVSAYWDITTLASDKAAPTDAELAQRWRQIRTDLLAMGQQQQRPVLITELGYPTLPWALKSPWDYIASKDGKLTAPDPRVQERGYQAFMSAFDDLISPRSRDPRFAGVLFYAWDVYHNGGPDDTGYGVRGKPTFDLLKQWMVDRR